MFCFRLILGGRGTGGRSGTGRGWLALFWGLVLVPLLGWGQVIIKHPENATVCVGEDAVFTSVVDGDFGSWKINGTPYGELTYEIKKQLPRETMLTGGDIRTTLTVNYNKTFDGLMVQSIVQIYGGPSAESGPAYVFYKSNQQYPATGLMAIVINQKTIRLNWQAPKSNLTTRFLISIHDLSAPGNAADPGDIYTTDTNHYDYHTKAACHHLQFGVIADECPDNNANSSQTPASSVTFKEPLVYPVTLEYADRAVRVDWHHDGRSAYRIEITDLDNNIRPGLDTCYNCPPYFYSPKACGRHYHLNFAVTPAQCAGTGFTYNASIRFYMDCLALAETGLIIEPATYTTPTESESESESAAIRPGLHPLLLGIVIISLTGAGWGE